MTSWSYHVTYRSSPLYQIVRLVNTSMADSGARQHDMNYGVIFRQLKISNDGSNPPNRTLVPALVFQLLTKNNTSQCNYQPTVIPVWCRRLLASWCRTVAWNPTMSRDDWYHTVWPGPWWRHNDTQPFHALWICNGHMIYLTVGAIRWTTSTGHVIGSTCHYDVTDIVCC